MSCCPSALRARPALESLQACTQVVHVLVEARRDERASVVARASRLVTLWTPVVGVDQSPVLPQPSP